MATDVIRFSFILTSVSVVTAVAEPTAISAIATHSLGLGLTQFVGSVVHASDWKININDAVIVAVRKLS